jgi:hypothetical protein
MRSIAVLPLPLLIAACTPTYEGTFDVTVGPELAATADDLSITVELSQFVDDLRIVAARDGQEYRTFRRLDDDVLSERLGFEGTRTVVTVPASETAKGQVWTFDAILTVGKTEVSSQATVTIGNTPPTVTAAIGPEFARSIDAIVATGEAADVDGDPTTMSYAWFVDDQPVDATGAALAAGVAPRGSVVRVEITANDGEADSAPATAELTVRNSPPSAAVTLEPADPDTLDDLFAVASGDDPDGDALTFDYGWTVNGEVVAGINPDFSGARTRRGDVIRVTVVARDGRTISDPASAEVTIRNSVPGAAELAITQSPSGPERDLVCRIVTPADDADKDDELTYTFAWRRDGEPWTGPTDTTTLPGDTISRADTDIGDTWTCSVTASDGVATGPEATATSEIVRWAGVRTFTNCRATKNKGPSQEQCDTAYTGATLEGEVELDGGIQLWVVPATGTYRISAFGAGAKNGDSSYANGKGAKIEGTFDLVEGDLLQIAVGQEGSLSGSYSGGGGGTWVMSADDEPLVIAGGGAGVAQYTYRAGCGGSSTNFAGLGSGSGTHSCALKTYDVGLGGRLSTTGWGSAGAGIFSDGASAMGTNNGGKSWIAGLEGGGDSSFSAYGGFGGGGGGNGSSRGGGGGGGYSGGDGGRMAGGGGSYNAGRSPSNTANNNDGHGKVTIDLLE